MISAVTRPESLSAPPFQLRLDEMAQIALCLLSFSITTFATVGRGSGMANHKSAEKRARQSERRRVMNRQNRSRLRTGIKALRAAVASGKPEEVQSLLPATVSVIDKSIQKGVIHK